MVSMTKIRRTKTAFAAALHENGGASKGFHQFLTFTKYFLKRLTNFPRFRLKLSNLL